MKALESILYHVNPLNDFKEIKIYKLNEGKFIENTERTRDHLFYGIRGTFKSITRGAWVGGVLGIPLAYALDYPLEFGFRNGAFLGVVLDTKQFMWRFIYHYFEKQMLDK